VQCIIFLQNYFCVQFKKIYDLNLALAPIFSTGTYIFIKNTEYNCLNIVNQTKVLSDTLSSTTERMFGEWTMNGNREEMTDSTAERIKGS